MNLEKNEESGSRFRLLLQRALRGDHDAAWKLIENYGNQLLHLLIVRRRDLRGVSDGPLDAPKLIAFLWEGLKGGMAGPDSVRRTEELALALQAATTDDAPPNLADPELSTVGLPSAEFPTLSTPSIFEGPQTPQEQLESARRRWKHLLVTPAVRSEILRQRLHGAAITEIASQLEIAEAVVRHVLDHEVRLEEGGSE